MVEVSLLSSFQALEAMIEAFMGSLLQIANVVNSVGRAISECILYHNDSNQN